MPAKSVRSFENDTDEINLRLRHRPAGRLTGTIGGWFLNRSFTAIGEEALSPPVKEKGFAGFFYEELTWPHVTFQFGARVNHATFNPEEDLQDTNFTDTSGSVGFLFRPAAVERQGRRLPSILARAARNPALEGLLTSFPLPGDLAFENATLVFEFGKGSRV